MSLEGPAPAPPRRGAARGFSLRELAGALLVYLMLAFLLTANTWRDPSNRWIGICCDQEQSMWFLAWLPTSVELGQNPLLTDRVNAPAGANLMWNASAPLVALAVAPITRTAGPILAYNVAILGGIALSGLACFLALRRYARGALGPLVGGGLYALSPFVTSQATLHLNLVMAWAPPLFLALLDELFVRRERRPSWLGVGLGVLAAAQLLTFEEILATSAIAGAVLAVVLALTARNRRLVADAARRGFGALVPGIATFAVLGGLPLAVQFLGPQQLHGRVQDPATFSTDLLNLVLPTPYQLIAPDAATQISTHFSGLYHEATAYVGLPLLLVLIAVVIGLRRDVRVRVAGAMAAVMFVLSLGPVLHVGGTSLQVPLPWLPFTLLPLLEHITPGRLTVFMWLAIAVLVAIAVDDAAGRARRPAFARLAVIGTALVFVLPAPLASWEATVPAFFSSWPSQGIGADEITLMAPWFTNGAGADPMLWAAVAEARPRIYEGYVYVPGPTGRPQYGPTGGPLANLMTRIQDHGFGLLARGAARDQVLRQLATAQIGSVIVGPMRYRDQMIAFFTDLLGSPPVERDGVAVWRNVAAAIARQ